MVCAGLLRVCRRRAWLPGLLGLGILLLLANIGVPHLPSAWLQPRPGPGLHLRRLDFSWESGGDGAGPGDGENSTAGPRTCRNSVQGHAVLADDRGAVCPRGDLLSSGCCDTNSSLTERYSCQDCEEEFSCCATFEYCVRDKI